MTDLSKMSSEDLLQAHTDNVVELFNSIFKSPLLSGSVDILKEHKITYMKDDLHQEIMRRLAVYDQVTKWQNITVEELSEEMDVKTNQKLTITNNADKDTSIIIEEIE